MEILGIDSFYMYWFGFVLGCIMLSFGIGGLVYTGKELSIRPMICSVMGGITGTTLLLLSLYLGRAYPSPITELKEILTIILFCSCFIILLSSGSIWKNFFLVDVTQKKTI
ncbi:hypothetical protein C0584_00785 [Candidatus Parcubacteria bacterium]|nr:MAG: hypothetical protein C0584_00785 [Candidatus Parcubacteria bacterium]